MSKPFVVDPAHLVRQADMAGLRQEHLVVDEAPQCDQLVYTACVAVVPKDAGEPHHADTSRSTRRCLPGSYRRRPFDDASRIRSSSGSWRAANSAPPYSPAKIRRPATSE